MVASMFLSSSLIIFQTTGRLCAHIFKLLDVPNFSGYSEDSLQAKQMNVNPGGKQNKMRAGWFVKGGLRFRQHMIFEGGQFKGLPKGLRQVCLERFGAEAITGK